ncbi:MAG: GIY-YIG nuclease family protein [Rhizobiaceae bacterium]|nr:GIY-YIG nuclease family protein [Rhizobiaceae bacterium]
MLRAIDEVEGGRATDRGRNPDWSRDETILLMNLYLSAPKAGKTHPEVIALSTMLRAAGRRNGRAVLASFRNPAGVAMRLRNFGRHDPNAPPGRDAGLRPGGAADLQVWREFGGNPIALAEEVTRIRRSLSADDWIPDTWSSRGPVPTFGLRTTTLADSRTGVYLLLLDGPIDVLAPQVEVDGRVLVKIGRTSDLDRRMAELAAGLPPGTLIRYVPISLREFGSSLNAHRFEQRLLGICDREGWSLGGEFAYAPLDALKAELAGPWPRDGPVCGP